MSEEHNIKAAPIASNHSKHHVKPHKYQLKVKPHEKETESIQSRFIKAFTKQIILSVKRRKFTRISHPIMNIQVPKISSSDVKENVTIMFQSQVPERKIVSEVPRLILNQPKLPVRKAPSVNQIKPIDWSHQGLPPPRIQPAQQPQVQNSINDLSLDKIRNIMQNPSVFSVECPGPSKPLVVVSQGLANVTNVTLADEEINAFMKDISQKTRIPLVPGLYKAVLGNLLIIAVVSEFVGTRFIIQKRN